MDANIDTNIDDNMDDNMDIDTNTDTNTDNIITSNDNVETPSTQSLPSTFIYTESKVNELCKNIQVKSVLRVKSHKYDDNTIIALLIKNEVVKYKCNISNCPLKRKAYWEKNKINLLLHRKNGVRDDLRKSNIELVCPNCYMQKYGIKNIVDQYIDCKNIDIDKTFINNNKNINDNKFISILTNIKKWDYKCCRDKCILKGEIIWIKDKINLLLNRKNDNLIDLRYDNLEFICPNCYMNEYGLTKFHQNCNLQIVKCRACQYFKINILPKHNRSSRICQTCNQKHSNNSDNSYVDAILSKSIEFAKMQDIRYYNSDEIVNKYISEEDIKNEIKFTQDLKNAITMSNIKAFNLDTSIIKPLSNLSNTRRTYTHSKNNNSDINSHNDTSVFKIDDNAIEELSNYFENISK